jgi:phosphate transport system substrate-binding protein
MAKVRETRGAIGYVEFGQVTRVALSYASLQNKAGQFVKPERAAFEAAAAGADWASATDFHLSLIDAPGAAAYPIAAITFVLMPAAPRSSSRLNQALWFFSHALDKGGADAASLGYVPLPSSLVGQVKAYWRDKFNFES